MKGIILAAGKGSRLYPITHHIPKPLLPLANRPTLEYAFDRLKEIDVREIGLVVGENEDVMRAALGTGSQYDLALEYIRQPEPKGLAHAVGFAKDYVGGEPFILYLGDGLYGDDFRPFRDRFEASGCANLNLVQAVDDPSRFGIANVEGDRIVRLVEKPKTPESNLAMAGVYFFQNQIWDVLPSLQPSPRGEYEITDAIQTLIDQGEMVLAGKYEGAWFDTGTRESFLASTRFLTQGSALIAQDAEVSGKISGASVVGEGARVECEALDGSVVLPGAHVRCRGTIRNSILAGTLEGAEFIDVVEWGA